LKKKMKKKIYKETIQALFKNLQKKILNKKKIHRVFNN
jgi:hypothetical protein